MNFVIIHRNAGGFLFLQGKRLLPVLKIFFVSLKGETFQTTASSQKEFIGYRRRSNH